MRLLVALGLLSLVLGCNDCEREPVEANLPPPGGSVTVAASGPGTARVLLHDAFSDGTTVEEPAPVVDGERELQAPLGRTTVHVWAETGSTQTHEATITDTCACEASADVPDALVAELGALPYAQVCAEPQQACRVEVTFGPRTSLDVTIEGPSMLASAGNAQLVASITGGTPPYQLTWAVVDHPEVQLPATVEVSVPIPDTRRIELDVVDAAGLTGHDEHEITIDAGTSSFFVYLDQAAVPPNATTSSVFQVAVQGFDGAGLVPALSLYPDLTHCTWSVQRDAQALTVADTSQCGSLLFGPTSVSPMVTLASGTWTVRATAHRADGSTGMTSPLFFVIP